ncbi:MAG: sulfotransferase [Rhodopila sp.]
MQQGRVIERNRRHLRRVAEDDLLHMNPEQTAGLADKGLGDFVSTGLIHLILPNARMIHLVRDPMDTCLSRFFEAFCERPAALLLRPSRDWSLLPHA